MPSTTERPGSRHRPRASVALLPELAELMNDQAKAGQRPARWEIHRILLNHLVAEKVITREKADALWDKLTRRFDDAPSPP